MPPFAPPAVVKPTLRPQPLRDPEAGAGAPARPPVRGASRSVVAAVVMIEIGFPDLDPMAVAWHGHYLRYFEQARAALMRKIGYDYPDMQASGYAWPVIEAKLRYVRAARYGQTLRVEARLLEWENRLRIAYQITDAETGARMTTGYTIQCAVDAAGELQLVSPDALRRCVEKFL